MSTVFIPLMGWGLAFLLTRITIPSIVTISREKRLFDEPNARSAQKTVIPTLGGLGIFIGFVLSLILTPQTEAMPILPYLIGSLMILLFVGLKDDLLDISPRKKLYAQIAAALLLIICADVRFTNLHGFLGIEEIPTIVGVPLTVFVMIVFTNSFNLIDGIDGLASGLTIFISSILGIWFFLTGHMDYCTISFALAGALSSFFYCNVFGKKNKLFMGDTGSLLIGMIVAMLIVQFNELNVSQTGPYAIESAPAVSFGLLIYPLFDTIRVFLIRLVQKRSPFSADKNHIHHRMLALGYSHKKATFTIIAANALFIIPLYFIQDFGISAVMIYNLIFAFLISCIPALHINKHDLIEENDPYQQILYPKKRDAQRLAAEAMKTKQENRNALVRALERMNIW